jgi:alcohol dehydrogenase class IV
MDAFTQLLESYLSTAANAMTDALALPALQCIARALPLAVERGNDNIEARADMAYAALISGITLANAGLGVVHGFASSIGGRYAIPHGLICGTLMGVANRKNVQMLRDEAPGHTALAKYEKVGRLFHDSSDQSGDYYIDHLLHTIDAWTERFQLSRLGHFGVTAGDIKALAADTGNKNNPLPLSQQAREDILSARL